MRIAVLGVGLIGGSIGLAARRRLDAEVAGFDPDRSLADRAIELGAIDSAPHTVAEAVEGAELVFCAAPVTALPGLAAEALDAVGEDGAVTDVGSVKRDVIAALGSDSRFIGGRGGRAGLLRRAREGTARARRGGARGGGRGLRRHRRRVREA